MAVRRITEQETGDVLQPAEMCTKTRERVMEVLRTKHTDTLPPTAASLYTYMDRTPELVPVDINKDMVTEVSGRIFGGAKTGGTD